jgi:hypothetical protein
MGDADGVIQQVYQTVTLPTNLIGATLGLQYYTVSSDPNQDDYLTVYFTDANLNPIINLGTTSSGSPTSGWVDSTTNFISYTTSGSLSAYAGQTVNVEFYVTTDPTFGYLTDFYLTGVSLVVGTTADIPANDNFANAIVVPARGLTNTVTTTYASLEPSEPKIVNNEGGHSLWWTWTATSLGTLTFNTPVTSFTTLLGVYTGSSVTDLTLVTNGTDRPLTFGVTPGTTYHFAIDGYNGESGNAQVVIRFTQDKTPPTVAITSPKAGADVTNSNVLVQGTARDNVGVASVFYRLENADRVTDWQLATGTASWSATVTGLIPGTNTVQVEAYDTSTNRSVIVSRLLNYVIPIPLSLSVVGEGTISGAKNDELLYLGYPYKLTAIPTAGFGFAGWTGDIVTNKPVLSFTMASNLSFTATFVDITKPTLSITAPVARERWSNSTFTVTGKAKDNVGVAAVWYQLNSGAWTANVSSPNAFTNWSASVTLNPGANTIKAYAVDAAENRSITNSVSFTYVLSAPLIVQINGSGKATPNYNNTLLEISNSYAMTATAGKGYVFSNWTTTAGAVITNGAVLRFVMASNLDYVANFVPNPFPAVEGTYGGLFYNSGELTPASSGYFSAAVNSTGGFTANFQQGGKRFSTSGQFSLMGTWSTASLKTWDDTAISLQLDMTGNTLDGNLSNDAWSAGMNAVRAANPAPQKGNYTLILPATNLDSGNGFGSVAVASTGAVTLSGTLGDGTKVTESAVVSEQGEWPVYVSLDSGNGMLLGWLAFTNEPGQDVEGTLTWLKSGSFTNQIAVVGSTYVVTKGEAAINLSQGYVLLQGGGLTSSITDTFTLGANNIVKGSDKLALTITTANGLFQGTATNSEGKTITIHGALLQNGTNGYGQFLNAGQIGNVFLGPQQ